MTKAIPIRRSFALTIFAFFAFLAPVQGQALAKMHKEALDSMKTGQWETAYQVLVRATDTYDGRALTLFGPRFGWFWFHRGYCEIQLGKFEDAMASMEKCYKKYNNNAIKDRDTATTNIYNKKALLLWGHAAKGAEEWALSIRMYKKFLDERDASRSTDGYERGVFYVNMAINHYKLKKIEEGNKYLETAIKGKVTFPTPNTGIMSAFNVMVEAVIEKKDESALLDFFSKNRAHIKLPPFEAHQFSPLFMKLAQDAKGADMIRSTFELYSLVPSTVAAIDDINARLGMLGNHQQTVRDSTMIVRKVDLDEDLEELEKALTGGKVNEVYAYLNTAVLHEENGNTRGAFAVYEQLERYYPNAKIMLDGKVEPAREKNLYNLVRTAAVLGEVLIAEQYGSRFLKDFPDSSHVPEVRRLMLTSLFFNGEYAKCEEVAERIIGPLEAGKPSKQHDICQFVLGGSKHYLGKFSEAQPILNDYLGTYNTKELADKIRVQAALYFQAANYSRLQEWTRSADLLDKFLEEYPDPKSNIYYPFALFDRANCYYAENEMEPALEFVTRVEKEFPGVSVMEQALGLKGNVLEGLFRFEEAEEYYLKALALAEQKDNDLVASENLFYLVGLIGKEKIGKEPNPRIAEALPYYDKFWEEHGADSPFKAKVAVAGIPAMTSVGKLDEALERLQGVIADIAKSPGTPGLEGAIGSYTDAYLSEKSPEELKDHYYSFPGIDSRDMATRALLRIAIIDVFEKEIANSDPEKEAKKIRDAQAMVDVLFKELRDDFKPTDLSNFILVKVGDFIRNKTTQPQNGRIYYEEALNRENDQSHKFAAIFGLADIDGKGTNDQKKNAIKLLKQVVADSDQVKEKEEALYLTATIYFSMDDLDNAIATATEYIDNRDFRRYNIQCRMLIGDAHDEAGRKDDAIMLYEQVWIPSMGAIKFSAPALKRWMELLWDRDSSSKGISDRQAAYEGGHKYIRMTASAVGRAKKDELVAYEEVKELVASYEARSEIKKVEEKEKD